MLYLICGDSHSRIFKADSFGKFCFLSFSGASISGISNSKSVTNHGAIIKHFAAASEEKKIMLMFGNVDIDFSYYHEAVVKNRELDESDFFAKRIQSYSTFLEDLHDATPNSQVIVLGIHLTPVKDDNFLDVTCGQINKSKEQLTSLGLDVSHRKRCERAINFNDALDSSISELEWARFIRVDKRMLGPDGVTDEIYSGRFRLDHHPNRKNALGLWREEMQNLVPLWS